jgi:hypothetical protein
MLKKILVVTIFFYTLTAWVNLAFAQNTTSGSADYTTAGVGAQIKQYLCAPSDPDPKQTSFTGSQVEYSANNNKASGDLYNCINRLYRFAIVTAAVVGVFFIVIAGYLYIGAGGNQESVDKAKSILASTVTSLVILFAGYILLKALNPDLIKFRPIQPPSVVLDTAEPPEAETGEPPAAQIPASAQVTTPITGSAGGSIAQLEAAGCTITSEDRPRNELPNLAAPMWQKLLQICSVASQSGSKPQVSSTVRRESKGSQHQLGCAVDFSDRQGSGFYDIKTHKGRPVGEAIYNAAKQAGITEDRINPGRDRDQSFHLHIDLKGKCP